jgi:lactate permease
MLVILTLLPLLTALLLFLVFQCKACDTSWTTLGVTIALVSLVPAFHRTPWQVFLSLGQGSAEMLTAAIVLLPVLIFGQIQQETGAIEILMHELARFVPDRDLQILLLVLGVGPCFEAVCGSGMGCAFILPLLIRLHHNKLKAVQLSLLSQIMVPWGNLGMGTALAANQVGLPVGALSIHTALLLFPCAIDFGIIALLLSGGLSALERHWQAALLGGCFLMLITCLCSQFFVMEVSGFLASVCVVALLLIWSLGTCWPSHEDVGEVEKIPFLLALLPYILLIMGMFASRLLPSVNVWLQTHGILVYPAIKLHLAMLSGPSLWLLLAVLVRLPLVSLQHIRRMSTQIWQQFLPVAIMLIGFLSTVALMQNSGMINLLGEAITMLGKNAVWAASLVGAAGGWLTCTPLGGNTLTIPLLMDASRQGSVSLAWLIAAQNASAAIATATSPLCVTLLATSISLVGKEALVFRRIGPMILWPLAQITFLLVWFASSLWLGRMIVVLMLLVIVNAPVILVVAKTVKHRPICVSYTDVSRGWTVQNTVGGGIPICFAKQHLRKHAISFQEDCRATAIISSPMMK